MTKKQRKTVREQGRKDYLAGKPITAFYEMPLPKSMVRHTEALRGLYEMGWREERDEARKKPRSPQEEAKVTA